MMAGAGVARSRRRRVAISWWVFVVFYRWWVQVLQERGDAWW
jgi:hypothetical protein